MKQFLSFVQKEFYHIFRDRRTMLILLVMPLVLVLLFGYVVTTEVKDTKVAVLDMSDDAMTERIINRFEANKYFTVVEKLNDATQIENVLKDGEINMIIVFNGNFVENVVHGGDASVELLVDGTEPNQASMRVTYAQQILNSCKLEIAQSRGVVKPSFQIEPVVKMLYNPQQKSEYNYVPGIIGMILLIICAMMSSVAIVREKENGTMEVLLASPLPPYYIILAKLIPYFVISSFNLVTILLMSFFLLHIPIAGSLIVLAGVSLLYVLVALSLGLLFSSLIDSQFAAMLLSGMVLMMPSMLLSGYLFPVESMPWVLQAISTIIPMRWFVEAIRKIMIQGVDAQYILKETVILIGMVIVFLTIALKKFKTRLE